MTFPTLSAPASPDLASSFAILEPARRSARFPRTASIDREGLVETHGYLDGSFFVSNPGWLSGGAVAWFLSTFGVDTPDALSALVESVAPGAGGVLFLPALTGAMAPRWAPGARGAFYGLTPSHGRAECGRALLEGCAFALRDVVERFDALGVPAARIRLTGGAREEPAVRADPRGRTQRPVEYGASGNAAPLGAAALASVAAGWFEDVADGGTSPAARLPHARARRVREGGL